MFPFRHLNGSPVALYLVAFCPTSVMCKWTHIDRACAEGYMLAEHVQCEPRKKAHREGKRAQGSCHFTELYIPYLPIFPGTMYLLLVVQGGQLQKECWRGDWIMPDLWLGG